MTESALDRLDPGTRNQWGLPSRAAGPTAADIDSENEQLRRENRELRRLLHEIDQERLDLIRLAEARDRGVLEVLSCGVCNVDFAIDQGWHQKLQRNGKEFWCPNGHCISYGSHVRSELERTRAALERAETRERAARDQADAAERQARAYKGHATRLRNRAAAGVCPCCTRTFQNLQRHMASQHPTFAGEAP